MPRDRCGPGSGLAGAGLFTTPMVSPTELILRRWLGGNPTATSCGAAEPCSGKAHEIISGAMSPCLVF